MEHNTRLLQSDLEDQSHVTVSASANYKVKVIMYNYCKATKVNKQTNIIINKFKEYLEGLHYIGQEISTLFSDEKYHTNSQRLFIQHKTLKI